MYQICVELIHNSMTRRKAFSCVTGILYKIKDKTSIKVTLISPVSCLCPNNLPTATRNVSNCYCIAPKPLKYTPLNSVKHKAF